MGTGTHATDDPTEAPTPFIIASRAPDGGHDPGIALLGVAVDLGTGGAAEAVAFEPGCDSRPGRVPGHSARVTLSRHGFAIPRVSRGKRDRGVR